MTSAVMENRKVGAGQSKPKKQRSWLARNFLTIILVSVLIVGIGLLLYPTFANWWNSTRQTKVLNQYISDLDSIDQAEADALILSAKDYNFEVAQQGFYWTLPKERKEVYDNQLNLSGIGIMGYIEINSIDVTLPIYHGTDEAILQEGIGHLEGTSLPVGAKSFDDELGIVTDPEDAAHIVVSGHRGLPSSRLFTDLDKLKEGDTFALNIYNNLMIYEVDQIRVVLPEDLSQLTLEKGQDYCTLVTCTPYGINSHRLLVRGRRVSTQDAERFIYRIQGHANQIKPAIVAVLMAAPILAALFLLVMANPFRRIKKKVRLEDFAPEVAEIANESHGSIILNESKRNK